MKLRRFTGLIAASGLAVVLFAAPAAAQTQYPPSSGTGSTSDTTPQPGQTITLSGDGFAPNTQGNVVLGTQFIRNFSTNAGGSFTVAVTIPCNTPAGPTTLSGTGTGANGEARTVSTAVTVGTNPIGCEAGAARARSLPRTGSTDSTTPLVAAGFGLVGIGAAAVVVARRRRTGEADAA